MNKPVVLLLALGSIIFMAASKPVAVASYPDAVPTVPDQLIRFHVVANSDTPGDQELKRKVRDAIVREMAPEFRQAQSIEEARQIATKNLTRMEQLATSTIKENGQTYRVKASFGQFLFPTKTYGKFSLPAGKYQAVRVVIGDGKGGNWWCVLFPPLCFLDLTNGLTANPALLVNSSESADSAKISGTKHQTAEQGKVEIRSFLWELWQKWVK